MTTPGETATTLIRQDLACPSCDYNLRGLHGDVVTCPECGAQVDVVRLVTERWTDPWYRAPGLNRLMAPVACMVVGLFGLGISGATFGPPLAIAWAVGLLVLWGGLMWQAAQQFRSRVQGIGLALLEHLLLLGYFVGGIGFVSGLLHTVTSLGDMFSLVRNGVLMLVCAAVIWGCRRGERFIAARCIREHLRRAAAMPPHLPES